MATSTTEVLAHIHRQQALHTKLLEDLRHYLNTGRKPSFQVPGPFQAPDPFQVSNPFEGRTP